MKVLCQIYKSDKNPEMYLYVDKKLGLESVPESLLKRFGTPLELMLMHLEPGKKLARADVTQVLQDISDNGFYLQMPPTAAEIYRREGAD